MAHQKLGNGQNTEQESDIAVVAPRNMGKGFGWNDERKQYEINVSEGNGVVLNPDGTVGLQLSVDEGNQLELRPNGIFLGSKVKPEKSFFYVSSLSGDDANTGTKEAPFKTINQAFIAIAQNKTNGHYEVYLKVGEYFEFPRTRVYFPQTNISLNIQYYGDNKYPDPRDVFGVYRPYGAEDLNRPTLEFTSYVDPDVGGVVYSGFNTGGDFTLGMYGLNVRYDTLQPGGFAGLGFYHNKLIFEGCVIQLNADHVGIGSAKVIRLRGNKFNGAKPNLYNLFISDLTPSIWTLDPLTVQGKGLGRYPDFVPMTGNEREVLKYNNICALAAFDTTTKTVFGFTPNWDVFSA